jgi:AcrR family transcriptional regulator
MARNRNDQDREEKRSEILDAAARLFVEQGYDGTSMGALAKAAGITPTTIYWYFDDKDAVLVAVLSQLIRTAGAEYDSDALPTLTDRLLWLTSVFDRMAPLIVAVHARAQVSSTVGEWHDRFHTASDAWLLEQVRAHLKARPLGDASDASEDHLAQVPRIWSYAMEGMVAHALPEAERRALCETLVRQLNAA